jgi:hypothetical protein
LVAGQGAGEAVARQSSNSKTWIETERDAFISVANNASTAVTPIRTTSPKARFESSSLKGAIIHGFHLSVSSTSGASHKATVNIYDESTATYSHYEVTVDLHPNTQARHMIETQSPLFDTPYYKITDVAGGGSKNYTILFYVKTME